MMAVKKVLGVLLLILSGLGVVLSLVGGAGVLRFRGPVLHSAEAAAGRTLKSLKAAERGLGGAADSLDPSLEMIDTVQAALEEIVLSLEDTAPLFGSMADVFGVELPAVIRSTQNSLGAAEETAVVVDRVLYALDAISFVSGVTYEPEVPLAVSIQDVSGSLDELEPSFLALEEGIEVASQNTALVREQLADLEGELGDMEAPLRETVDSLQEYQELTGKLGDQLEGISGRLSLWVNRLALGLGLVLLWNLVVQAALFLYGWELVFGVRTE